MTFSLTNPQIYNGGNNIFPLRDPFILSRTGSGNRCGCTVSFSKKESGALKTTLK